MTASSFEAAIRRATARRHRILAEDLVRLRQDAGISRAALAAAQAAPRTTLP